jgi:hypothetical protein
MSGRLLNQKDSSPVRAIDLRERVSVSRAEPLQKIVKDLELRNVRQRNTTDNAIRVIGLLQVH